MKTCRTPASAILIAAAILAGCASPGYYPPATSQSYPVPVQSYPAPSQSYYQSYGMIDSIQLLQGGATGNVGNVGVGAVVGGVVGGLLGNQVGGGRGRKAATVAGVVGGAMIGNEIERNSQGRDAYQIGVRLDNGTHQTITQESAADLQIGTRVRVENNRVYRYY
ncbi:glycine zipper 2TM domain-containing protein [Noviherbaspirillum sp.]|jgi:outer membrane lipoprotein SlyB|uniref:glycine zipper 2TM domain-containing protein n=1 Tax=Noviherbaspirillum sp. TaxID=1926288 RepID=UPI0025F9DF8B|nr:glycine zipper 2TM domain-containing protein [Noviherbaspirillum sp.]